MKRMLLTICYDGTEYHGWQVQPNAVTVQQVLCETLEKMLGKPTNVVGTSRTDAGVHAREFFCHLDCDNTIPETAFLRGLNSLLPKDIAVKDCKEVPLDFHSRYNALGKTYCYYIYNSNKKDPFKMRCAWQIERPLNLSLMNEFARKIVGTHDFYAFSSSGRSVTETVRTISECKIEREGDFVKLTVSADGFLYNMVRIIVGTAVDVSDGKILIEEVEEILTSKRRDKAGMTAPPQGLFLEKVYY